MQFADHHIALYARLSKDRSGLSENVHIQLREGEEYVEDNRRRHRANLLVEYGRGEHTKADYKVMLAAADEAIETAEAEVTRHLAGQATAQLPTDRALREVWDDASNDWRAEIIKLLVEKIVVLPGRPGSHRYKEWRFNPAHVQIIWKPLVQEVKLSAAALVIAQRKLRLAAAYPAPHRLPRFRPGHSYRAGESRTTLSHAA